MFSRSLTNCARLLYPRVLSSRLPPRGAPSRRLPRRVNATAEAANEGRKQQLFDSFASSAFELLLHHGVKPSELTSRVTQARKDASAELPRLAVLYCDMNGSYGLSSKFRDFIEGEEVEGADTGEYRVLGAELLQPFGHALAQEWPFITQLLTAYLSPQGAVCRRHMESALHLASGLQWLDEASAILVRIAAATSSGADQRPPQFGSTAWTKTHSMYGMRSYLDVHLRESCLPSAAARHERLLSREALERMQEIAESVISTVTADKAAFEVMAVGVPFADAMLETAREMQQNEPRWQDEGRGDGLSFADAVAKLGERHEAIWLSQNKFDKGFMRHLARCPGHVSQLLQTEGAPPATFVELELALCTASECSCNLGVAFVPRLCEWGVSEYHGLETVHLL